jgi:hypothetical protein
VTCEQVGCPDDAVFRVYWPGQTVVLCQAHTLTALRVAAHMGVRLTTAKLGTLFEWALERQGGS